MILLVNIKCMHAEGKNHHYGRKLKVPNKITTILKMYFKSLSLISCFWNANHPRNILTLLYSKLLTLSCCVNLGFPASRAWDKILVQEVEKWSQEVGVCVWWEWDRTRLKAKTRMPFEICYRLWKLFLPKSEQIPQWNPHVFTWNIGSWDIYFLAAMLHFRVVTRGSFCMSVKFSYLSVYWVWSRFQKKDPEQMQKDEQ